MNRAFSVLSRAIVLGLLAGNLASAATLPPTNSAMCAANLLIARQDSSVGGMTQARTFFSELNRRWGVQEEQEAGAGITFQGLQLDSRELKDADPRLAALGQQLSDLELSLKLMESESEGNPFNFITGYTVNGSEAIQQHATLLWQLADFLSTPQKPTDPLETLQLAFYFLTSTLKPLLAMTYLDIIAMELTKVASGEIPNPVALVGASIGAGIFTESITRKVLDRDWHLRNRLIEYIKFSTEPKTTRRWAFRSYSHRLPLNMVSNLNSRLPTGSDILSMRFRDGHTNTGRFLERKLLKKEESYDWVYVDELRSRDPATQEPVLSVMVRASTDKDRPRPPRRKKTVKAPERKLVTDDGWKF